MRLKLSSNQSWSIGFCFNSIRTLRAYEVCSLKRQTVCRTRSTPCSWTRSYRCQIGSLENWQASRILRTDGWLQAVSQHLPSRSMAFLAIGYMSCHTELTITYSRHEYAPRVNNKPLIS